MWYKHIYICVCVDIYMKGKFTRPSYCFKGDQHTHTRWWWRMLREWSTEPLSHIVSLILDFSRFFRFPSVFFICICISPSFHLHVSCRSFELTKKKNFEYFSPLFLLIHRRLLLLYHRLIPFLPPGNRGCNHLWTCPS